MPIKPLNWRGEGEKGGGRGKEVEVERERSSEVKCFFLLTNCVCGVGWAAQ
jgi:hypothetical protein